MLKKILKKYWKTIIPLFILIIFENAALIISTLAINELVNNVVNKDIHNIIVSIAVFGSLLFFYTIVHYLKNHFQYKAILKMSYLHVGQVVDHVNSLNYLTIKNKGEGFYESWLNNDVNNVREEYFSNIFNIFYNVTFLLFSISALVYLHWILLLTILALVLINFIVTFIVIKHQEKMNVNFFQMLEDLSIQLHNFIIGHKILIRNNASYQMHSLMLNFYQKQNLKLTQNRAKYVLIYCWMNVSSGLVIALLITAVVLLGLYSFISVGAIVSVFIIGSSFFGTTHDLAWKISQIVNSRNIYQKVFAKGDKTIKGIELPTLAFSNITISNLSFAYEQKVVLNNFNLKIEKKQKYAIVGPNGCGKSTLVNLMMGLNNNFNGQIMINNQKIQELSEQSLRQLFNFLDSKNKIFYGTIADNLNFWQDQKLDHVIVEEIVKMNKKTNDLINQTQQLSEGQKQKINILRAMINKKPILVLDEAFSNLDYNNQNYFIENILKNPNLTIIMITHNLSQHLRPYFQKVIEMKTAN